MIDITERKEFQTTDDSSRTVLVGEAYKGVIIAELIRDGENQHIMVTHSVRLSRGEIAKLAAMYPILPKAKPVVPTWAND